MNARLRIMVDSREIEEAEAPDREVVARWHKAEGTSRDAGKDLGQESRLTLYYQAGLQAATALVRAAGFRVPGDGSPPPHLRGRSRAGGRRAFPHRAGDERVSPQAPPGDLRLGRYAGRCIGGIAGVEELARNVGRMLELGHAWLVANRPGLGAELEPPSRT